MTLTCPKCDAPRVASSDPLARCSSCGVIFAKFDPDAAEELRARQEALRRGERVSRISPPRQESHRTAPQIEATNGLTQRQLIGLVGAAALAIGVFVPLLSGPFGMSLNYFSNGKGDGVFMLAMAGCTVALVLTRKFHLIWATGGLSFGMLAFTFFRLQSGITEMKDKMDRDLQGNPFRGLADVAVASVQMQWGWAVLAIGAALIVACAAMKKG
jgi:hypothetical protein